MKTYLSIDIDYFNEENPLERRMHSFFNQVKNLNIPGILVVDHDELVPHVDSFDWDKLVNVDYHSDISDILYSKEKGYYCNKTEKKEECNEGTWVNFVRGKDGHYEWRYPNKQAFSYWGRCESTPSEYPFFEPGNRCYHSWENDIRAVHGLRGLDLNDVVAFGVCLSPGWANEQVLHMFLDKFYNKLGCDIDTRAKDLYGDYIRFPDSFNQYIWVQDYQIP